MAKSTTTAHLRCRFINSSFKALSTRMWPAPEFHFGFPYQAILRPTASACAICMPGEGTVTLLVAERDRLNRVTEALQDRDIRVSPNTMA